MQLYPGKLTDDNPKKSRHGQKHNVTMEAEFPNATKNITENF